MWEESDINVTGFCLIVLKTIYRDESLELPTSCCIIGIEELNEQINFQKNCVASYNDGIFYERNCKHILLIGEAMSVKIQFGN